MTWVAAPNGWDCSKYWVYEQHADHVLKFRNYHAKRVHKPFIICAYCGLGPRDGRALRYTPVGRVCKGGHTRSERISFNDAKGKNPRRSAFRASDCHSQENASPIT